ncbi:hypothetical protein HY967_03255 [Candidatus Jorgensenbacteria bacterium]|nr:hypothetical protein [Candidatus Jorgensenbacteria bacterium]
MDIVSHGLWGSLTFGRKNKKSFWLSFLFGVAPDLFSFGIFFISTFLGLTERPDWTRAEPPSLSTIPAYVGYFYNFTHSLIIATSVFLIIWLIYRKPFLEMLAWPLHILFDIPTHSYQFFPTPFLWPLSNFKFNGHSWADPIIFFPNLAVLIILYAVFLIRKKRANH